MSAAKTLLIVDDSSMSRQVLRARFSKLRRNWQIYDSDNGADAVAMCEWVNPDFVSMDVNMPNMSGLEAADKIRARWPEIRIVLITANVQEATQKWAGERGICLIEKNIPVSEASIERAVAHLEQANSEHGVRPS